MENSSGRGEDLNQGPGVPSANGGAPEGARLPDELRWLRIAAMLALAGTGLVLLFRQFGPEGLLSMAEVALGLGFVIFFHELGHFLVAKWCDVHVETFSVGFGPAIPGLSFRRGETLYKIAWFPLGGYVKMVGEGGESDEGDDDPRSFKNKTVWQRMAIISAGVTMNVILGLACFVVVYMAHGVERPAGIVGTVDAGSPAWRKGVPSGALIRQIGSITNPYFDDLQPEVAFSSKGEKLTLAYQLPDQSGKVEQIQIEPRRDEKDSRPVIGIAPATQLKLFPKRRGNEAALTESAAAQASPHFELGDTIVACTDPKHPDQVTSLDGNYFEFHRRLVELAGKPMVVRVLRQKSDKEATTIDLHVPPAYDYSLGMIMRMGQVTAIREKSPASEAKVIARDPSQGISEGDIIDQVRVKEADGSETWYVSSPNKAAKEKVTIKPVDPIRLPAELEQWAERTKGPKKVTLVVLRTANHAERGQNVELILNWDERWRFDKEVSYGLVSPMPIPELGLAYQVETSIEAVTEKLPGGQPSPAAEAGLKRGDVIKAVRFDRPGKEPGQREPGKWLSIDSDQWANMAYRLQEAASFKLVTLRVERGGEVQEYVLTAVADEDWPLADRGLILMTDLVLQKADGVGQAVQLGMQRTYYFIVQMYQSLRAIITSRVSAKGGLGGPILIATAAYAYASENIWSFLFFLGIISVNLAVINFLPIPILDGGHMVFLIYEKIRGIPASESARSAATIVGLAVILLLVVFTFWLDISRFF